MYRRASILQSLRRRNARIVRILAPLFAMAWLSAAASPCLAAANRDVNAATTAAGSDTGSGTVPDPHAGHANGSHESPLQHSHGHDDHEGYCPHCPPSRGGPAPIAHVSCAAAADGATPAEHPQPELKVAAGPASVLPASALPNPRPPQRVAAVSGPDPPEVPLNLLHCVFLI